MKNKQLKIEKLLNQTFFPEKSEIKATKISGLCCLPVEKLIYYLHACYLIHILLYTQNV